MKMRRIPVILLTLLIAVGAARAQKIVDQILTLVNDDIITRIDLLWSIALDPSAPSPAGPVSPDILRQKLDVMIDERLIAQDAARLPGVEVPQDELEKKRRMLIERFPSEASFRQRIESVGLTPQRLDQLIRERILIERFKEFRFQSFVFVREEEIQRYYTEVLAPQVRARGAVPPPVEQVREQIRAILREEKINEEIDRWLIEARQRADIVQLAEP
jgi:hypothetical protein